MSDLELDLAAVGLLTSLDRSCRK